MCYYLRMSCLVQSAVSGKMLAAIVLQFFLCETSGALNIKMYQVDDGPRSIGSYVTIKSEILNGQPNEKVTVICASLNESVETIYFTITYHNWTDVTNVTEEPNIANSQYVSFTPSVGENLSRIITWFFDYLPERYDNLTLVTRIVMRSSMRTILDVKACKSPTTVDTVHQLSNYEITANSHGHYKDAGTCRCAPGYALFHPDGSPVNATATCELDATWNGCRNSQCWRAPQVSNVSQVNKTAGALDPFKCNFTEGFPNKTKVLYKVNNETLLSPYILKSSYHGKNLSCEVVSNYTKETGNTAESTLQKITVYFSPENTSLPNTTIMISLNESEELIFSFYANPRQGNLSTYVKVLNSAVPNGLFNWTNDITKIGDTTQYKRVLELNLAFAAEETQTYAVCANSSSPEGEDCEKLTISNKVSATLKPTDITDTTSESTIDAESSNQGGISIGIIIGVAVGVLAVLVILAVICFLRRNHGNIKEERINEIYEASPGPGPSIETVYTGTGENSRSEMTTNVAYEASPHQPEIQDVYTTVNREDKKKGRTEKDKTKNGSTATTSAEENVPAVTDVYAMVKK